MKRSVLISLLVVSPMLFLSCQKSKDSSSSSAIQPNPEPVNVSTISKGSESNVSIPEEMVIRDEKSLNEFWEKIPPTYLPATYPYHVDFSKESILAVFLGNQDSSGASVLIEG